jgi:DNA helicase-2/ATP-dependent DNA helicase PcrA
MELDKYQEEIANDFSGEIAVVAGPGSGKTRTLIERAERIYNSGEKPQSILLISYTNKVRSEIKKRLRDRNLELEKVNVHTFHSFGVYLLRMHGSLIGINKNFEIIDDEDAKNILNKIYIELNIEKSVFPIKKTLKQLSELFTKKQEAFSNSSAFVDFLNSLSPNSKLESNDIYDKIFNYYTYYKRNNNYLDFDDIISYTNALLSKKDARKVVSKIKYVMVDEAQDLNTRQYEFIDLLRKNGIYNILLVGDFDQNIYSWRGARTDLFKQFYSGAKKYSLGINYRSTPKIVNYSRKLIEHNTNRIDIDLVSSISNNSLTPICNFFGSSEEELKWISTTIKELISKNVMPSEIAILYRANYLSRSIESELALERNLLNLSNIGPKKAEYVLNNNFNMLSDNDKKTIKQFYSILDEAINMELISSKLQFMIDKLQYKELWDDGNIEDRMENYSELLRFIETFDNELIGLQDFLDNISLLNKRDERTDLNNCIKLMTLHSSKGLEFKYVFIISALDGIIPNDRSIAEDMLEEERRLMYVGITRAKEQVYITASPFFGYSASYITISRFVKEAGININNLGNHDPFYDNSQNDYSNSGITFTADYTAGKKKNYDFNVEVILAVFLGWLGIHCFYKKQYTKGILYMFTFGLFGIGWFVDLIILLIKAIGNSKK